jgi:hypothetical protein
MASDKQQRQQELDVLMEWVSDVINLKKNVPRLADVIKYAYLTLGFRQLSTSAIARRLRLHPAYHMNSLQKRSYHKGKRYRPIIVNTLGYLHGDIGFFSVTREYETPLKYRGGFLVLKDVLSRFLYVSILNKNRTADSIIRAFENIFKKHTEIFGPQGHKIKSIAFDRETSVMSKKVQNFLLDNNISFHAFKYSASKSKMAENAIRLIRTDMKRLTKPEKGFYWWNLMDDVVDGLNKKEIVINKKHLGWTPAEINTTNVHRFRQDLDNADPTHYFSQFEIARHQVKFKYSVGDIVRPKLIVTSSAVIGEKRSEVNLEKDPFLITEQIAYVNRQLEAAPAYRCINQHTREEEIFDEHDLAESFT